MNNSARLDAAIADVVSREPVFPREQGQYGYVGGKTKRSPKQEGPVPRDLHNASSSTPSARNPAPAPSNSMHPVPAAKGSTKPQSALLESQEGGEWAIRIDNASPPALGEKSSFTQEDTLEDNPKRERADPGYVSWSIVYPGPLLYRVSHSLPVSCNVCSRSLSA
jgi:hypothetical protein